MRESLGKAYVIIRTRKQALDAVKIAKQQLLSFLLRHGLRYQNGSY